MMFSCLIRLKGEDASENTTMTLTSYTLTPSILKVGKKIHVGAVKIAEFLLNNTFNNFKRAHFRVQTP